MEDVFFIADHNVWHQKRKLCNGLRTNKKQDKEKLRLTQLTEVTVGPPLWSTVPVSLLCLHLEKGQRKTTCQNAHAKNILKEKTKCIMS